MKKIRVKTLLIVSLFLTMALGIFSSSLNVAYAAEETNTSSEYVNTLTDLETTKLFGGATLYEQKMSSPLNGDYSKEWQEHFVQWVDLQNYEGVQLVTWTPQSVDKWTAATTKKCAEDWEKAHPGWIVLAGINGDFFNNSGTITYEPTNNFMADGDMYRADYVGNYRQVIGITDENEIIVGSPSFSEKMQLYIYNEDGTVSEKLDINGYNTTPSETGITLYTKDATTVYDLTGYSVYVGKYTMCRISNGSKKTVFVKGSIETVRDGKASEKPVISKEIENGDGTTTTVTVREFYLATKDSSYAEKLTSGTNVKCQFDYTGDWSDVTQSVGYIYQLLDNGVSQHQYSSDAFIYTDHPRTFIGFKEDGTPVLMVVDGRGDATNQGVSLFEGAEIMKLAGCVNAYNLDGGGSSTLIVRNESGNFEVINRPSDGSERSTGNAIFLVMRQPTAYAATSTTTSIKFDKETNSYSQSATDIVINVNGIDYPMTDSSVTVTGLDMDTTYDINITYKLDGETCISKIYATTKEYTPGLDFEPTDKGFIITRRKTDEVLKTIGATFTINDEVYTMGDVDKFVIDGLFKDTTYNISYTYQVLNTQTNKVYEKSVDTKQLSTLSYNVPDIAKFEAEQNTKRSRIEIAYEYSDGDNLLTQAYVLVNETKYQLTKKYGSLKVEDLDFNNKTYVVKMVLEYTTPTGIDRIIESDEILFKPHEHEWSDATCTSSKTCPICGETEGEPLGHSYSEKVVSPTCEEQGYTIFDCTQCDYEYKGNYTDSLGHSWTEATSDAPKTCTVCGKTSGEPLKKGCKKSSLATIILSITILVSGLYLIRRKK